MEEVKVVPKQEVQVVPPEENMFFYENIRNLGRSQVVQNLHYIASWTYRDGKADFIFLNKKMIRLSSEFRKNPRLKRGDEARGWKLHVGVDSTREDNNLEKAWNAIVNILMEYQILEAKIITEVVRQKMLNPEFSLNRPINLGKEITIYIFRNTEKNEDEWQRFINALEAALEKKGVRPSLIFNPKDKIIPNSKYLSCRDDSPPTRAQKLNPLRTVEVGKLPLADALEIEYPILQINQQESCSSCCRTSMRK